MRRLLLLLLPVLLLVPVTASAQEAPPPADVTLSYADDGTTVHVLPGQLVDVVLRTAYDSGGVVRPVEGFDRGLPTLQLVRLGSTPMELTARFQALSAGRYGGSTEVRPQVLRAESQFGCDDSGRSCTEPVRPWSVQLVVDDGPPATAAFPCTPVAYAVPSPGPGSAAASQSSDGGTVRLTVGGSLQLLLGSCEEPYPLPPTADGPVLRRGGVRFDRSSGTFLTSFSAVATGTATVRAAFDARCAHRTGPDGVAECAAPTRVFTLDVQVDERPPAPCAVSLTGPGRAAAGSTVTLSGTTAPGDAVQVLFRRRGEQVFTARRALTASSDGRFSTTVAATDDVRYYATTGRCTSDPGLLQAVPVVTGPAVVRRGQTVTLRVLAPVGVRTLLFFRGPGEPFAPRRVFTGPGTTTYVATVDQRYYPATPTSTGTPRLTQVR